MAGVGFAGFTIADFYCDNLAIVVFGIRSFGGKGFLREAVLQKPRTALLILSLVFEILLMSFASSWKLKRTTRLSESLSSSHDFEYGKLDHGSNDREFQDSQARVLMNYQNRLNLHKSQFVIPPTTPNRIIL